MIDSKKLFRFNFKTKPITAKAAKKSAKDAKKNLELPYQMYWPDLLCVLCVLFLAIFAVKSLSWGDDPQPTLCAAASRRRLPPRIIEV